MTGLDVPRWGRVDFTEAEHRIAEGEDIHALYLTTTEASRALPALKATDGLAAAAARLRKLLEGPASSAELRS
ncbi:hypothetical protein ADK57_25620 [Streptomyces sp. MMG1533]|uniref:hypothetical protein n=1 Tax=Streptomyces sp. MMG1533 TaxID=1415546 RepID=UPI0006AE60B3|nr:hypothetical protein [Streptomyces sp. MMG1533]KOU62027.1 hypothetical protein ADK57_25620 [Streptomyces sp. MMG1533]